MKCGEQVVKKEIDYWLGCRLLYFKQVLNCRNWFLVRAGSAVAGDLLRQARVLVLNDIHIIEEVLKPILL
jgi:hypothetical protein